MNKNFLKVEKLFKHDYGGEPKFNTMVKPGSKLYTVLSQTGKRDILSTLQENFSIKKKRNKPKTKRKKKTTRNRNKSLKKKKVKKKSK
tara:strand:+ start:56164 stop:56427 length:264 start_codon:yes stop_codon:yes gene_type:complete